jgi:hypothetical protein
MMAGKKGNLSGHPGKHFPDASCLWAGQLKLPGMATLRAKGNFDSLCQLGVM